MRVRMTVLAGLVMLPMSLVALRAISIQVQQFLDPCVQWGVQTQRIVSIGPDAPCRGITIEPDTKGIAATRTALFAGIIIIAAGLAVIGAGTSRPGFLVTAAVIMFLESVPFFLSTSIFTPLPLLTGGGLLLLKRQLIHFPG